MSFSIEREPIVSTVDASVAAESSRMSSAIFLLLCVVPVFATLMFGAVDSATWIFISVFWALIVLSWLADAWNAGGILLSTSWLQFPLIGLIAIGLVQLLPFGGGAGDLVSGGSRSLSLDPYATRFFVIRLVVYLTFFSACLTFINNGRRLRNVVTAVVIFGSLMAFFGILQRLANPDGIYGMRITAQAIPFGPFVNQHHFAAFMQMTGGLALGLFFGRDTARDKKLMLATAFVIMGVATLLTSSRGGLLGFLAAAAFVTLLNYLIGRFLRSDSVDADASRGGYRKLVLAAASISFIVIIFGTALLLGGNDSVLRGIGIANADTDITTGRLHFWPIALRIFLEHPIIGAGFDAFGVAFTKHDTWNGALRVEQAHNEYLQTLADGGVAGLACVAGFIYLLFRKSLAVITATVGFRQSAAIGAIAGCLGILIHSFFDFPLRTHSNAFFFLLLAAIATVTVTIEPEARRRHHRRT